MDTEIDMIINQMQASYASQLSNCGAATCSGGNSGSSPSSPPSPISTVLTATFDAIADPTAFDLKTYIEAVKGKTKSETVTALVKLWEVALEYSVQDDTTEAVLTAATAKVMNVVADAIKVVIKNGSRRLGDKRRLAATAEVTMTTKDAAVAKTFMMSSSNTTNLGTELGGSVSVAKAAQAKAKVETTVLTEPSKVDALKNQVEAAGSDAGFTVTATVGTVGTSTESLESSNNSSWSFGLAPLLILLVKMIQ